MTVLLLADEAAFGAGHGPDWTVGAELSAAPPVQHPYFSLPVQHPGSTGTGCKEELYALCTPGAAIALLCPGWLGTKAWSFIQPALRQPARAASPLPDFTGGRRFRPLWYAVSPAVLAFLFGSALPIYFYGTVWARTYFLNGPYSSPITALFTQWFGTRWYILGFLPAVALVLAVLLSAVGMRDRKRQS